ncbi:MAG: GP88 family protein [Candidatus Nanopelagicaceae bacterium]
MRLLTAPAANPKIAKGLAANYATYILHLAPADLSGHNTCAKATVGCKKACLNTAGRGGMFKKGESTNVIQQARIRKTRMFFENRNEFLSQLIADIELAIKQCAKKGLTPVFRLNGTSDISWEKYDIIQRFPNVQFYDYTKVLGRKVSHLHNYHLTFSAADGNDADVLKAIQQGYNVATVFGLKKSQPMPEIFNGRRVFNGDNSDLRFLDPKNVIVGLYAKGKAKKDTSGFVKYPQIQLKLAA